MRKPPKTIDAYLATVSPDRRAALEKLRKTILSILPDADECISYAMPAFRHAGYVVAGFLATSKGCSYFPFSGKTLATVAADVKVHEQTKSALHFDPKRPLPRALVRKLLKARIAETERRGAKKPARLPPRTSRSRKRTAPAGIITSGHDNATARTVAVAKGEAVPARPLRATLKKIIANNRAGGWRQLKAARRVP